MIVEQVKSYWNSSFGFLSNQWNCNEYWNLRKIYEFLNANAADKTNKSNEFSCECDYSVD